MPLTDFSKIENKFILHKGISLKELESMPYFRFQSLVDDWVEEDKQQKSEESKQQDSQKQKMPKMESPKMPNMKMPSLKF